MKKALHGLSQSWFGLVWFGNGSGNDPFCVAALPAPSAFTAAPPLALSSKDRSRDPQQHKTIGKGKSESAA
ncbi:hypothetical protein, partial [Pseudomonas putida]|uniref:hypothetical protein n=1 Tax=Pseudomonas putida TaxID=303 RepID=UPI0037C9E825